MKPLAEKGMVVFFRVDASIEIGIGHVMRCLTLADTLRSNGAECHFVCREHRGHLMGQIAERGYQVHLLPVDPNFKTCSQVESNCSKLPIYASWLGSDWNSDARQTSKCIGSRHVDWLIVDHYSLDARWEKELRGKCCKLMVIDDLANRHHDCDLLLDQTYGRLTSSYTQLIPKKCKIFTGAKYALLRPEFAELREYSIHRRNKAGLKRLLISMGGIDKNNMTGKVLQVLQSCSLPQDCFIWVVMGESSPWLDDVKALAEKMSWTVEVKVGVSNMAQIMADTDLAIGASGSTAWERCCLGVPTLMTVLADNQRTIAHALSEIKAVQLFNDAEELKEIINVVAERLALMVPAASCVTDGLGVKHISKYLTGELYASRS